MEIMEQEAKPPVETAKSKKIEKPKEPSPQMKALIEIGIPIRLAVFHRAVRSGGKDGTPENAFYAKTDKGNPVPSRIAKMWYTPHGLVTEQAGVYKIIPLANVSDTFVL
jgi:hypothetical protein